MRFFGLAAAVLGLAALQTGGKAAAQDVPKAFTCTFALGASYRYEKGAFRGGRTRSSLAFDVTDIDVEAQTAKMQAGTRVVPLKVVQAIDATHFIEVAGEGYLNLTTIYGDAGPDQRHAAVHSRHFGVLGQPVVSQYRGACKVKG